MTREEEDEVQQELLELQNVVVVRVCCLFITVETDQMIKEPLNVDLPSAPTEEIRDQGDSAFAFNKFR